MGLTAIVLDSREPAWVQQLSFGGVEKTISALDAGDALCLADDGSLLLIERKSGTDLLESMRDNRLFNQIEGMRQVTPWVYVVVCGHIAPAAGGAVYVNGKETGWVWAAVQGALATAQEIGAVIVSAATELDYETTVLRLANRKRDTVRVHPQRDVIPLSEAECVLFSLPGLGPERVRAVLDKCGTAAAALEFLTGDDGYKIDGISSGTKGAVRRALGLTESLELAVVTRDEPVLPKAIKQAKETVKA